MDVTSPDEAATSIDFVIATRDRADMLERLLESLQSVRGIDDAHVRVLVVDNGSVDHTAECLGRAAQRVPYQLLALREATPGKSHALNTAIAACTATWVVFFDDDERVADDWLDAFAMARREYNPDFVAGRYVPEFEAAPPSWLPPAASAMVLGQHPADLLTQPLNTREALMWGGNCAIRREALLKIGGFDVSLGRRNGRDGLGCEDTDVQIRLIEAGYRGWYEPRLRIFHWVSVRRLSPAYFRERMYWAGQVSFHFGRLRGAERQIPTWFGVPRWRFRGALRSLYRSARARLAGDVANAFDQYLSVLSFCGYCVAAWRHRADRLTASSLPYRGSVSPKAFENRVSP